MARKVIAPAAASAVLILSFLLLSGVEAGLQTGGCKFYPSRLSICDLCKPRCQDEGNDSGFCDARKNCICVDCSKHGNGPSRSLRPALEPKGSMSMMNMDRVAS
ncbi:hypothetical protein PVAP13_8KG359000 [Panicum virgatum]|uniref:Knottin scorpion toxin-like domain-containing protein n=1 Tax=Panicum virgatum TaxID=38727 RepID=A0A8T0PSG7_PANVG|nr:hypothetical protein PVAP13_8KG359000 [Panicum virgatum]